MVDLPITTQEIAGRLGGNDSVDAEDVLRAEGRKWNGKGKPPSRGAAVGWLLLHGGPGMTLERAGAIVGESGTLTAVGERVRKRKTLDEIRRDEAKKNREERAERAAAGQQTQAQAIAEEMGLDEDQADELEALLGGEIGGPGEVDTRGAPLWPFEGSPETLGALEVENKSWHSKAIEKGKHFGGGSPTTPARYYEADTLGPLKWSPEQRADLQRVMFDIGLYGKDGKVHLGKWSAKDQAVYAELLSSANVEGLTWWEMLQQWKRNPPQDLLDEINKGEGGERAPLVIQHTNPADIRTAARDVSRTLTGESDRSFIERAPGGYNQIETQAQTAAYNAAEQGGTVTDAPSVGAYLDEELRRTNPLEVDGYQFLNQFQTFMSMLGAG